MADLKVKAVDEENNELPTEEGIQSYCAEDLADYKVLKQVVFVDSLPMTPVGKIMKEDFFKPENNSFKSQQ